MLVAWRLSAKAALFAGVLLLTGFLMWLDKTTPQAGLWALLLLSVSVGFIHGALDAVLLPQRFASRLQAGFMFASYLLLVVVLGWVLGAAVSLALWLLLLLSAWHFGEPYGRWNGLSAFSNGLTRVVVGGAPVMLPVWLASDQLAAVLADVVTAAGLQGWHNLARAWLGLLAVWLVVCGLKRMRVLRYAWCELLASAVLYALFSPLMAFALYFGIYHAPVHIWRVWRCLRASAKKPFSTATAATLLVLATGATWILGASLWWFLSSTSQAITDWAAALRWLIVAFAALTAPHLLLISLCAVYLSQPDADKIDK